MIVEAVEGVAVVVRWPALGLALRVPVGWRPCWIVWTLHGRTVRLERAPIV